MSYANIFELTKCLQDCVEYCRNNPDWAQSEFYLTLLEDALQELEKSSARADQELSQWRMEARDDRLAWKQLARELAAIQKALREVNAVGFLDQRVMYRNTERLLAAVAEMITYLREREEEINFASDRIEKLERLRQKALSEGQESDRALDEYLRFSKLRSNGLTKAKDTIANVRRAMRRDLGTDHPKYQAIRWPYQVASDEKVL